MNDDQLKKKWNQMETDKKVLHYNIPITTSAMKTEMKRFEQRIQFRDCREILTASGLIIFLIVLAITSDGFQRIGSLLLIAYFMWIIFYLIRTKMKRPMFSISKSLREQLIDYNAYVQRQQRLVDSVLLWYLLPIIPGAIFIHLGFESTVLAIISGSIVVLSCTYVYYTNKSAARVNFPPLLEELDEAIASLEE